jgi:hypothetical protein
MSKPKPITTRGLHNLTQRLADLLFERLGMDAIRKAAERDRQQGIYDLIRPVLPSGVTNREVRDVAIIVAEAVKEQPLPNTFSAATYSVYLRED